MTDRQILFSGPMIRALLEGRKTQTRRVFKGIEADGNGTFHVFNRHGGLIGVSEADVPTEAPDYVPYAVGDRLWVREAHSLLPRTAYRGSVSTGTIDQVEHPTDGYTAAVFREGFDRSGRPRWRPGIHMPRWASRLTLIVTDVRVQKLQEISTSDCFAEGIQRPACLSNPNVPMLGSDKTLHDNTVRDFRSRWDGLNAKRGYGWEQNPWVVALTFEVIKQNIDAIERAAA